MDPELAGWEAAVADTERKVFDELFDWLVDKEGESSRRARPKLPTIDLSHRGPRERPPRQSQSQSRPEGQEFSKIDDFAKNGRVLGLSSDGFYSVAQRPTEREIL